MTTSKADVSLQLPFRFSKPREQGITVVSDRGIPLGMLRNIFQNYAGFIDYGRLAAGTAYFDPNIADKVKLYREFDIEPYFSGTLFEKYYRQGNFEGYIEFLKRIGIGTAEISDISLIAPIGQRLEIIKRLADEFQVIGKVGAKDSGHIGSPSDWVETMNRYLEAGCQFVVAEGRAESSGMYRLNGEIREGLVADIVKGVDEQKVIFEASKTSSQGWFVQLLGANVNIGNVGIGDALILESLRNGVHFETLDVS